MSSAGALSRLPGIRVRRLVFLQALWLASLIALMGWWGTLALRQADRIRELEARVEQVEVTSTPTAPTQFARTQRMLIWEGGFFLGLLLLASGSLWALARRDRNRQKGLQAFFASVTHELRTPLTSIRLQAESLAELMEPRQHEDELNLVKRLLEDVQRLEAQVERTLELSRLEGGGGLQVKPIGPAMWISRNLGHWSRPYGDRLQASAWIPDDLRIFADPIALQVIFRNLMENASRHSGKEPVKVQITVKVLPKNKAQILFYDDGPGGPGGNAVGQPFVKGAQSQGAGIGLYLVRALMERMGGRVEFKGGPGFPVELEFQQAPREKLGELHG